MRCLPIAVIATLSGALTIGDQAHAEGNGIPALSRPPLLKEPTYQATPKYNLLAFGDTAGVKVWMVEDGKRLFVDKNANGDLTIDGAPIQPSNVRKVGADGWDHNYLLDAITPSDGSRHTNFDLRRWNYSDPQDSSGLSLSVDDRLPMYAGWFGTFWSTRPETAPVVHFGSPFTPRLLRSKEFTIGPEKRRLSLGFINRGSGPGAESRLSIEAQVPQSVPVRGDRFFARYGEDKSRF